MSSLILLGLLIGVPIVLAFVWRVSALLMFASLFGAAVFVRFLGDDISLVSSALIRGSQSALITQIALLLAPLFLTMFFARRSLSTGRIMFNVLPIIFIGLSTAVLTLPLLSSGVQGAIFANPYGNLLRQSQEDIIGITVLLNLFLIWISFRPHKEHHGKHHK